MVDYVIKDVDINSTVSAPDDIRDYDRILKFGRDCRNLFKMLGEGRLCKVVSPSRVLDGKEIEEYRKYFCKKAKEDRVNYIYFTVPVTVEKVRIRNEIG